MWWQVDVVVVVNPMTAVAIGLVDAGSLRYD